jgi:hypothetical protein
MEKFTLVLTNQELEIVYRSLLEVPAKHSLPVIQVIEKQVKEQEVKPEDAKDEPDQATDK